MRHLTICGSVLILITCTTSDLLAATPGRERGATSQVRIEGFDPLIPTLRKWYVPQDLFYYYQWGGYKYTNYARNTFERYVSTELEGRGKYDIFGNWLTRGWQIYEWRQQQPRSFGSTVLKEARYNNWFSKVIVASDSKGQYHSALTIGDEIRTTLTPLTFSRARFNGVQWDIASDKYNSTLLLSRVSRPILAASETRLDPRQDYTNLIGLRSTAQLGDFVELGVAFVNTHFGSSRSEFAETSLAGLLPAKLNSGNVTEVIIRITDDSPGDGSGALYFFSEMIVDGEPSAVEPFVSGGRLRRGFLEAVAEAPIELRFPVPEPLGVEKVRFDLVLSNDYRVDVTSNLQVNAALQPIFLPVTRANGNVQDNTNQRLVSFHYAIPSANQIGSLTLEVDDVLGFQVRGEFARNTQYYRYPNINFAKLSDLHKSDRTADAFFLNVTKRSGRFFGYGEAFGMDHDYSTRGYITNALNNFVDYEDSRRNWYEYVDDNDDQDREVDWARAGGGTADISIFPGLDENNDLISDFNENQNLTPDYDEPFLRHYVDPPEFLFGVDMNNNTVVDRFENDEEPDYPYKKGHQGYNLYGGGEIYPGLNVTIGRSREWLPAGNERSEMWYSLLTLSRDHPRLGRVELFHMLKFVADDIADPVVLWIQRPGSSGGLRPKSDPLIAGDTVVNEGFAGHTYVAGNLTVRNKLRIDHFRQRGDAAEKLGNSLFLGLINKADRPFEVGDGIIVTPRWKSMWLRRTQGRESDLDNNFSQILSLSGMFPLLSHSSIEVGVEGVLFWNSEPIPDPLPPEYTDDFVGKVFTAQHSNRVEYLGYDIIANVGFQVNDINFDTLTELDVSNTIAFVQVFAGLEQERQGGRPTQRRGYLY